LGRIISIVGAFDEHEELPRWMLQEILEKKTIVLQESCDKLHEEVASLHATITHLHTRSVFIGWRKPTHGLKMMLLHSRKIAFVYLMSIKV